MRGLVLVVGLLVAAPAWSAGGEDDIVSAKEHFRRGSKLFDLGRFEEAAKEYEAAYEAKDDPVLLYNIAQAHRLAKHTDRALFFYKTYLRKVPNARNRAEVQVRITELEALLEQENRSQRPPNVPLPPRGETGGAVEPAPSSVNGEPSAATPAPGASSVPPSAMPATTSDAGRAKRLAGLAIAGGGVALVVVGVVMGVLARSNADSINSAARAGGTFDPGRESTGHAEDAAGIALYSVGGAAVVTGAVLFTLGMRDRARAGHAMRLAPGRGLVAVSW
jgi:tetratricopeptide (TPR) repeat protein